jgi:hypothetical protein
MVKVMMLERYKCLTRPLSTAAWDMTFRLRRSYSLSRIVGAKVDCYGGIDAIRLLPNLVTTSDEYKGIGGEKEGGQKSRCRRD